jgi:hypothetical protein
LVIICWQWMGEGNFKTYKKWVGIILLTYIIMFKICPYVQNRVSHADLRIGTPMYRSDANDMLVDIQNDGPGDLQKTKPSIGFVDVTKKEITWIKSGKASFIRPSETVRFRFPKPDSVAEHCLIVVESRNLLTGYVVEPFYMYAKNPGEMAWGSYYRNMGVVDDKQSELFDEIIQGVQYDFYHRNWGKFKWIKDILLT